MDKKVSTVILAAGLSSRMGRLKALLEIGGEKAIVRLIDANIKAGITDIVVVLGYKSGEIAKYIDRKNVKCVINEDYMTGMFSSVQKGAAQISPGSAGFMLMPVDIPLIKVNTIRELAEFFSRGSCDIALPYFGERKGHPPVISRKCIPGILGGNPARGMKDIIDSEEWSKGRFQTVDQAILQEMDTMAQYLELLEYHSSSRVPNRDECGEIWRRCGLDENIIRHQEAVAESALKMGRKLAQKGEEIDLGLLEAAALLHDIKKKERNHPQRAGEFLEKLGYGKLADAVAEHMDLCSIEEGRVTEKELLYLADKMVKGSEVVGIEARFRDMLHHPEVEVRRRAECRYSDSLRIFRKVRKKISGRNIYLVRHGAIEKPAVKTYLGSTDLCLSQEGIQQAELLRERFSKLPIEAVYCSGLRRAVDTARIIAEGFGGEPETRLEFNEIDMGEWEGKSFDEVKEKYPGEFEARGSDLFNYKTPGGESFRDVQERAMRALEDILGRTCGDIVIVAHSGVKRSLIANLKRMSIEECFARPQDYGSVDVITLNV
ncbi:MAG: metal dependent phosphohydrolase [Firmicutes bacterium]|nr:metal dependent phosphohydrolase [Bacillota bacterium]